ncbi:hypothetical protein L1049_005030 [Liquidambar formosana]|uniref:Reverse transcriptase n=1 Tax=Liquidambar formosana TaxID=63359 RepID=A0AAP0RQL9_LIQFO
MWLTSMRKEESNKSAGLTNIKERLDKGIVNPAWRSLFPRATVLHLPAIRSNHNPLLINTVGEQANVLRPFKFEGMWVRDNSSYAVVERPRLWQLKELMLSSFVNVLNTQRKSKERGIGRSLVIVSNKTFVNHFQKLYTTSHPDCPDNLELLIPTARNQEDNDSLLEIPSFDEIREVVFQMPSQKSLWPMEILYDFSKKSSKGALMGFKVDMAKAYDKLEWSFIKKVLQRPMGEINPQRGLRKGNPLSPFIFILCTEVFSKSGQKVNSEKSGVLFSKNILPTKATSIRASLGVKKIRKDAVYLGLPMIVGRSKRKVFDPILTKVCDRINGWKAKLISYVG